LVLLTIMQAGVGSPFLCLGLPPCRTVVLAWRGLSKAEKLEGGGGWHEESKAWGRTLDKRWWRKVPSLTPSSGEVVEGGEGHMEATSLVPSSPWRRGSNVGKYVERPCSTSCCEGGGEEEVEGP